MGQGKRMVNLNNQSVIQYIVRGGVLKMVGILQLDNRLVPLLLDLENEKLYTVSDLIERAKDLGLIDDADEKQESLFIQLLGLLSRHQFPSEGDATGSVHKTSMTPAWFGIRWESAVAGNKISAWT